VEKVLDPTSVIPLYHQLKELIMESIESGKWKPGDMIPSENQFQTEYNVSRNTVKRALDDLVQEGLLYRVQGKGTFVALPKIEQSISGFYSFSKVLREKGYEPKDIILSFQHLPAKPSVARRLQLEEGDRVVELKRLRCARDEPIILETSYIPAKLTPGISQEMLENSSLYDLLQSRFGIYVVKAKEIFEPVLIRNYESEYLQVEEGYPALLLERIAYDSEGRLVEFCRSVVRGDKCRFYTELL